MLAYVEQLKQLVGSYPSGPALLSLIGGLTNAESVAKAVVSVVQEVASGKGNKAPAPLAQPAASTSHEQISKAVGMSWIAPRGKFDLVFCKEYFVLCNPKSEVVVPYKAIADVAIFDDVPSASSANAKGRVLLFFNLKKDASVFNGKTQLQALVLQTAAKAELSLPSPKGGEPLEGPAPVVVCQTLGMLNVPGDAFCSPSPDVFSAPGSTPYVSANVKANQGLLFPLAQGLCFLERPAMFLSKGDIAAVELSRAGGTSSSFDLLCHMADGATVEFGQITRENLGALAAYIRSQRLRVGTGKEEEEEEEQGEDDGEAASDDDDSEDEEDSDFDPNKSDDEEAAPGGRKRSRPGGEQEERTRAEGDALGDGSSGEGSDDAATSGSDSDSDSDSGSGSEGDAELVSDDDIPSSAIRKLAQAAKPARKKKRSTDGG